MLVAGIVWLEQAYLRLRITGGGSESTPPLPRVIVALRDSSQSHLGEIQRETLSKTVGGSGRLWPALTVRDSGLFVEGCSWRTGAPGPGAIVRGPHKTFKRGAFKSFKSF